MDKKHIDQLKKAFDHHHGVSQRQVARRFNCDQSYRSKILKNKTNIRYYKKKKIPHRSESQLARIKPLYQHIYRNFRNFDFVLDDESYFTYANTTLAGKRLIPFIDEHYKNEEYLFWPDLASSHYANEVVSFLDANNIKYLPKIKNPPNVPEARPIEDFWGQLKRLVYEDNWQATCIPQLKLHIMNCLNKMDPEVAKCYASMTSVRLGRIAFNDVIENQ